ncbi:flagellar protein FlaG [Saccharibacillus alkalitolerans]|uniref:Flagellar protein FlaG n=1 Tax=Saccharibacillus alkalitolerans TaxID=2705290 RepID=A0ABX0F817_9BACL|nr:flagellar protein FlaG [Saccharibacillus alkalitolerans]NGZ76119.1 flagellar protein FlaG [Saccharibacillus alkalitolerans]
MDSSIAGGLGGASPLPQSSYPKKEYNPKHDDNKASDLLQPASMTTIPQLHQDHEKMVQELKKAIDAIQGPQKTLEISVHEQTNAIMIKVLNRETGDMIREIPSEKILDVVAKMMEFTGILVDKKI